MQTLKSEQVCAVENLNLDGEDGLTPGRTRRKNGLIMLKYMKND